MAHKRVFSCKSMLYSSTTELVGVEKMALTKCRECKAEISDRAKTCPQCGAPVRKKSSVVPAFVIVVLILSFIMLSERETSVKKNTVQVASSATITSSPVVVDNPASALLEQKAADWQQADDSLKRQAVELTIERLKATNRLGKRLLNQTDNEAGLLAATNELLNAMNTTITTSNIESKPEMYNELKVSELAEMIMINHGWFKD